VVVVALFNWATTYVYMVGQAGLAARPPFRRTEG